MASSFQTVCTVTISVQHAPSCAPKHFACAYFWTCKRFNYYCLFTLYENGGHFFFTAEPASARAGFTSRNDGVDKVSASQQESDTPPGTTNMWKRTQEVHPESEPPQKKKVKRGAEEEQEEGEITGSSDEEEKGEHGDKSSDGANKTEVEVSSPQC